MQLQTHIDLFDFQDEDAKYLYSDIIDKTIDECETKEQKIRREILDAYTATMCRFFRISSLILGDYISEEEWNSDDDNPEFGVKIGTSIFKTNTLNMLYSLGRLNLFEDPESDYKVEFDHIARKNKKAHQKNRTLMTKEFYKEIQDSLIGYIEFAEFQNYCANHGLPDSMRNREQGGMSSIFHFTNHFKEELSDTSFEFIEVRSYQGKYNLNMNMAKMYSDMSKTFHDFLNRITIIRGDHFAMREGINNGYYDNHLSKDNTTREEAIKITNLNILLFSSLYNFVDYLLYMLHFLSNKAFDTSKFIQMKYLYENKKGNVGMLNYDNDKINGLLTKEDFEKMMGKRDDFNKDDDEDGEEPQC